MMKAKTRPKIFKIASPFFLISLGLLLAGVVINVLAKNNSGFADAWQSGVASVPRAALAYITNIIPWSLAESCIILIPCIVALLIYGASRAVSGSWTSTLRYALNIAAIAGIIYAMLLINFSSGYYTTSVDKKLGLDRQKVSAQELYDTASSLLDGIDGCVGEVEFVYGDRSVMPYDLHRMNVLLNEAYDKACDKYPFLSRFYSEPKPVALSEPWTYTHIAGVYSFFTGEANININFPDYTLPYTAAHEMAHQRGIAREDEANFIAFLVCLESDDPYIRYSAYASVYEYVGSSLYSADKELYKDIYYNRVPRLLKNEMNSYSRFFEKYRENKVATVSENLNNTFLQSQGQKEGTRSYGLVVDLAVAYYKNGVAE